MKKSFLLFAALFATIGLTTAQTLTIPDVYVLQGGTASFELVVDVPANSYVGFQFETTFPTGINYTGKTIVSSDWDGSFSTSNINYKGSSNSGTLTPIPAGEIAIATAEIEADASLALGTYDVTISNFEFLGYSGGAEDKKIADVTFKVIVTDRMILAENASQAPSAATDVNVTVKRTIKAGEWSTICLPFAMTKTKFQTAFGTDAELKEYKGYSTEMDWDTATPTAITLQFGDFEWKNFVTKTAAGTPYLIKTTKDIESFDVDKVTILTELTDVSAGDTDNGFAGKFKGVIAKTTVPDKGLFISGNKFYYSTGATKIKAFRGWFNLEAIYNVPFDLSAPVFLSFDGETTGINGVHGLFEDGAFYDLNGMKVENPTKKGVYIQNGKKVVVK